MTPLQFYKCMSEDTRLKSLLLITIKGELCVCDLTAALELSQPKVSRHLAELRKCQLLLDERRGKWVYYQLNPELPSWAREVLTLTANENTDFLADCANKLEQALTARSCC
ncbi:metalloregulator ArsR/SmtB family transcription factor [Endozoicomonas sp. G2_1]|uniref:metalloregulator ArsR/SmtB family transcription factor n=1 Tax=Endozoicomonas sp. G2_1 TaxID=2821091 RepID=UPI001ADBE1C0|nr:metalloregulator ArsR/SmtB family transcription factor [Endozoicomonas sp. G2_1]MBO9490912.1 metalloregulator ArsR/SmtB family transcription factor [Endozoicomonas sp. G2_1]